MSDLTSPETAPWFTEHDVTLYQGHVLDVLPTLAAGSVNCVVTSPPYYGLRDYGVDGQIGLEPSPAEYVETMRAVFAGVRRVLREDGTLWLNLGDSYVSKPPGNVRGVSDCSGLHGAQTSEKYRDTLTRGMGTKRDTTGHGIAEKNLMGIPWRVAFALQDDGWTLRNAVIWSKPNAMPESVTDRLSTRYEHVFLFSRSRRYWFDLDAIKEPLLTAERGATGHVFGGANKAAQLVAAGSRDGGTARRSGNTYDALPDGGRNPGDVWTIATQPYPGAHFATMPPKFAERCILAGCPQDGIVFDPFAGSGTTLMVARNLLRKSIGVELNPEYCGLIVDRIGQTPLDFGEATA